MAPVRELSFPKKVQILRGPCCIQNPRFRSLSSFLTTSSKKKVIVRIDKNYWRKIGFQFKDDDPSEMEYTGSLTDLYDKMIKEINKDLSYSLLGSGDRYINTKQGKRKIHTGKRGGKYYVLNKNKIYIK